MYTVDSTVSFTIARPQLKTGEVAADAISVRSVDPDGIFGSISLTTDVVPTLSAAGEISFSDVLNKKGCSGIVMGRSIIKGNIKNNLKKLTQELK